MALRIKNSSLIKKYFGVANNVAGIATNSILKRNPNLLKLLISQSDRSNLKKKFVNKRNKVHSNFINNKATSEEVNIQKDNTELKELSNNNSFAINQNDEISFEKENISDQDNHCYKKQDKEFYCLKWKSCDGIRFYKVYIQPTLLGGYTVTISWGNSQTSKCGTNSFTLNSIEEVDYEVNKIHKQKKSQGYIFEE